MDQIRSILDAQALFAIQSSSVLTNELATLAREDAQKTTRDARRLNTITVLGLIYLPASFVAVRLFLTPRPPVRIQIVCGSMLMRDIQTLLGTQYVKVGTSDSGKVTLIVASEMVIFVVLTIILLAITIGGWLVWENWASIQQKWDSLRKRRESSAV